MSEIEKEDSEAGLLDLGELHNFLKSKGRIVAVCYRVPTDDIAVDDAVARYRSKMINALQRQGRKKRMRISPTNCHVDAYPAGGHTYIKGWFDVYDAKGAGAPERDNTRKDVPREGLFLAEDSEVVG